MGGTDSQRRQTVSKIDYQALREAAEKATPGRVGDRIDGSGSIKYECHGYDGSLVLRTDHKNMEYGFIGDNSNADELFFRLCVPDVILALLDELEAAEKRIAEQQSAIIAPGIMRCAGCGFVLTKNSINMAAGTITAGDSKTEPCPNGCGPLWPVTWKEQALQMRDDSEQWFIELQQAKNRIAELEARTVKLPEYRNSPDMHTKQFYEAIGFNQGLDVFIEALRAAGIGVKGE
ncbi:ead/Ea22-like family protein [Escherichia coli]|nr:ead/Ea22-like family protein [Escherichia coli]